MTKKDFQKLRIFVSRPSDCEEEARTVKRVVEELNKTSGENYNLVLQVVDWRDVAPAAGKTGQAVIDKQIGTYDVLIGLMWKRYGTEIHGSTKGGAQHEVDDALRKHKKDGSPHVMFYFKKQPPSSMDEIDPSQWDKVCKFQKRLEKAGLYQTFDSVQTFQILLTAHLHKVMEDIAGPRLDGSTNRQSVFEAFHDYIHWARDGVKEVHNYYKRLKNAHYSNRQELRRQVTEKRNEWLHKVLEKIVKIFECQSDPGITFWCAVRAINNAGAYSTIGRAGTFEQKRKNESQDIPETQGFPRYLKARYEKGEPVIILGAKRERSMWKKTHSDKYGDDRNIIAAPVCLYSGKKLEMTMILYVCTPLENVFQDSHKPIMKCCSDVLSMYWGATTNYLELR